MPLTAVSLEPDPLPGTELMPSEHLVKEEMRLRRRKGFAQFADSNPGALSLCPER